MKFKALICTLNSKYIHSSLAPWCLYTACKKELGDEYEVKVAEGTINEKEEEIYKIFLFMFAILITFSFLLQSFLPSFLHSPAFLQ